MKRTISKTGKRSKVRLNLRLKSHFKNGRVQVVNKRRLKAFFNYCRACPSAEHYELRVEYLPGVVNEGGYPTKEDLLYALKCFTSADELDYIENYCGIDNTPN